MVILYVSRYGSSGRNILPNTIALDDTTFSMAAAMAVRAWYVRDSGGRVVVVVLRSFMGGTEGF